MNIMAMTESKRHGGKKDVLKRGNDQFDISNNYPGIVIQLLRVTPELAAQFLEANFKNNRKISDDSISSYGLDIADGEWLLTGDSIKFDREGRMIDGQHRLNACIQAGTPFDTIVIYGLDPRCRLIIDGGRKRRASDALTIVGSKSPLLLSAAARWMLVMKNPRLMKGRTRTSVILKVAAKHPKIQQSILKSSKTPYISPSLATALHYVVSELIGRPDVADHFVEVMTSGIPKIENDPVHAYRERMIKIGNRNTFISRQAMHYLATVTMNALLKNEELKHMPSSFVDSKGRNKIATLVGLDVDLI